MKSKNTSLPSQGALPPPTESEAFRLQHRAYVNTLNAMDILVLATPSGRERNEQTSMRDRLREMKEKGV
jgi:hypothetical protein